MKQKFLTTFIGVGSFSIISFTISFGLDLTEFFPATHRTKPPPPTPQNEPIRRIPGHNTHLSPQPAASIDATCPYRYANSAILLNSPVRRRFGMMFTSTFGARDIVMGR